MGTDECPNGGLEVGKHECKPRYKLEKIPVHKLKHNDGFKLNESDDKWYMFDTFLGDYDDYIGCYVSGGKFGIKDIIYEKPKYVYKIILLKNS